MKDLIDAIRATQALLEDALEACIDLTTDRPEEECASVLSYLYDAEDALRSALEETLDSQR